MTTIVGPAAAWKAQTWAVKVAEEFCGEGTMTLDAKSLVPLLRLAWREGHFQRIMDEAERLTADLTSAGALVKVEKDGERPRFTQLAEDMRPAAPLDTPPAA